MCYSLKQHCNIFQQMLRVLVQLNVIRYYLQKFKRKYTCGMPHLQIQKQTFKATRTKMQWNYLF